MTPNYPTKDFIVSLNYAWKYGICKPEDMPKARKEFGYWADCKLAELIDTNTEYGLVKDEKNIKSSTIK